MAGRQATGAPPSAQRGSESHSVILRIIIVIIIIYPFCIFAVFILLKSPLFYLYLLFENCLVSMLASHGVEVLQRQRNGAVRGRRRIGIDGHGRARESQQIGIFRREREQRLEGMSANARSRDASAAHPRRTFS